MIQRLESVIWEIERSVRPVLVVAHQAVVGAVYADVDQHRAGADMLGADDPWSADRSDQDVGA